MVRTNDISSHLKPHLQAIPVCLAALVMWAVSGGWYLALVPPDLAGIDNIGIVLSLFGLCLFMADRVAQLWFHTRTKVLVLFTWTWGLIFVAWGLLEWLHSFSRRHAAVFIVHWFVFSIVIAWTFILTARRRHRME
ncbi:MAG: hypothetical protein JXI33_07550 [Candidatus Aminicenantes bacterium]|nr:hypothetical protein [Candidatus Aminicenantes bacterium]